MGGGAAKRCLTTVNARTKGPYTQNSKSTPSAQHPKSLRQRDLRHPNLPSLPHFPGLHPSCLPFHLPYLTCAAARSASERPAIFLGLGAPLLRNELRNPSAYWSAGSHKHIRSEACAGAAAMVRLPACRYTPTNMLGYNVSSTCPPCSGSWPRWWRRGAGTTPQAVHPTFKSLPSAHL
jgi:hypothetical protein